MPENSPPRHRASNACSSEPEQPNMMMEEAEPISSMPMQGRRPHRSLSRPQKMPDGTDAKL